MKVTSAKKHSAYGLGIIFRKKDVSIGYNPRIDIEYTIIELIIFNRSVYFTWQKEL